jgi:hypothetical protein
VLLDVALELCCDALTCSTAAVVPPPSDASNDFGRKLARWGPSVLKAVVTIDVPPKMAVLRRSSSPSRVTPLLLVSTGLSRATDRRPSTSRPS